MLYTLTHIGPKKWGILYDGRLLATVMTQKSALEVLAKLAKSPRLAQLEAGVSNAVPLKRSSRGRKPKFQAPTISI